MEFIADSNKNCLKIGIPASLFETLRFSEVKILKSNHLYQ